MSKVSKRGAKLHLLTAREVLNAGDGDHGDGGGLYLRVRDSDRSAAWIYRFTSPTGRRREMGLGAAHRANAQQAGASLTGARDLAHRCREQLRAGIDPIDARDGRRDAQREAEAAKRSAEALDHWTLARCARDYFERAIEPSRTPKHAAQWISSLENHLAPELWHAHVDSIEPPALLAALLAVKPHERARNLKGDKLPETMQRLRQRLDATYEDAIFHRRATKNPAAAVKRKMREAAPKRDRGQFRALPYKEAPAFMAVLRQAEGIAARCLEFAMLTAARTSEALLAEWSEFDLDAAVWVVPPNRMKSGEAHTIFLSPRAVDILKDMQRLGERHVFPTNAKRDVDGASAAMSNMSMLVTLDRLGYRDRTTVHGLCRATFSTWANETGAARPDVIEACLAHEESNRGRAAYNRSKFNDERRALLEAWAEYLARPAAPVIELESKRA